jgi:hypothetical protein
MIVNDTVFGTMSYNSGWEKQEQIVLWGKAFTVRVVARAYSGQEILDIQRNAYTEYKNNIGQIEGSIKNSLFEYYEEHYYYIANTTEFIPNLYKPGQITLDTVIELIKIRTLIFDRTGDYGFLCDCAWNREDGIAIKLNGIIVIGEQEMLI